MMPAFTAALLGVRAELVIRTSRERQAKDVTELQEDVKHEPTHRRFSSTPVENNGSQLGSDDLITKLLLKYDRSQDLVFFLVLGAFSKNKGERLKAVLQYVLGLSSEVVQQAWQLYQDKLKLPEGADSELEKVYNFINRGHAAWLASQIEI